MSFGDHLEELRGYLTRSLMGIGVAVVICLFFGKTILAWIYLPLLVVQHANGLTPNLQVLSPTAAFTAYLKVGLLAGMILSMPWTIYQVWRFVASGLYANERRFVKLLLPISTGLFVVGVLFLYTIVLPVVLNFFVRFNQNFPIRDLAPTGFHRLLLSDAEPAPPVAPFETTATFPVYRDDPADAAVGDAWVNTSARRLVIKTPDGLVSTPLEKGSAPSSLHSQFAIDYYVSFVLMLALAFGIAFETPVVVFFLAWSGLVATATMRAARRYVLLGTITFAAMLTPPDVISQLLLSGPMYLLFEIGLAVASMTERKSTATASG